MLEELRPRKYEYYRCLPFLGSVLEGFDDWLSQRGYTLASRRYYLSLIRCVDPYLQDHYECELHDLTVDDWEACRRWLAVHHPRSACAVTTVRHYLQESRKSRPHIPKIEIHCGFG